MLVYPIDSQPENYHCVLRNISPLSYTSPYPFLATTFLIDANNCGCDLLENNDKYHNKILKFIVIIVIDFNELSLTPFSVNCWFCLG